MTNDTEKQPQTIAQFIETHGITFEAIRANKNPNMDADQWHKGANHWVCTFSRAAQIVGQTVSYPASKLGSPRFEDVISADRLTTFFSQGSAHKEPPTAADVLDCLAMDAAGVENAKDFEDWASEYGYDTDSRKAERTYKICQQQAADLKEFLGDEAYQSLLWDTERN